ncbi:MATE family efflux transporter [Chloroflexota bacterium]
MKEPSGIQRKKALFYRDWTKGSIVRNLLILAWPISIGSILNMLGPTIDMIWVGRLGANAMAGVGVAGMAVVLLNSARMGLNTGTRALIARAVGADNYEEANHVVQQAFVVSAFFSVFMAVIGIFFAESILRAFGVEPEVVREGTAYLQIMFIGSVAMSFRMMVEGIMQASGDTMTPMRINISFRVFHIILCPFLVFGWWIFPRLEVSGAALTNVISQSLGVFLGLWILFSGRSRLLLNLRNFRIDFHTIWRIVRIGFPATVTGVERTFANVILMTFIVPFGTAAVVAQTICDRVSNLLHMPAMGFGRSAGVLAGQNLGAKQPGRAEKSAWIAVGLCTGFMVIGSVFIWFLAEDIVRIFSNDPDVLLITSGFLRIAIGSYLVFGVTMVLTESLTGVGDTMVPMVTTLITMWGIQVPLAYFLSKTPIGAYGVRWAIVTAIVIRAIIYALYFRLGKWKYKKV